MVGIKDLLVHKQTVFAWLLNIANLSPDLYNPRVIHENIYVDIIMIFDAKMC